MKILIDMNLSPQWAPKLQNQGFEATHWSSVGAANSADEVIFQYAAAGGWIIMTMDLDFTAILANTGARGPSVVQIRAHDVSPATMLMIVVSALKEHREVLESGAILSLDHKKGRVKLLPLRRP